VSSSTNGPETGTAARAASRRSQRTRAQETTRKGGVGIGREPCSTGIMHTDMHALALEGLQASERGDARQPASKPRRASQRQQQQQQALSSSTTSMTNAGHHVIQACDG
jgi:hypothetical protein